MDAGDKREGHGLWNQRQGDRQAGQDFDLDATRREARKIGTDASGRRELAGEFGEIGSGHVSGIQDWGS